MAAIFTFGAILVAGAGAAGIMQSGSRESIKAVKPFQGADFELRRKVSATCLFPCITHVLFTMAFA